MSFTRFLKSGMLSLLAAADFTALSGLAEEPVSPEVALRSLVLLEDQLRTAADEADRGTAARGILRIGTPLAQGPMRPAHAAEVAAALEAGQELPEAWRGYVGFWALRALAAVELDETDAGRQAAWVMRVLARAEPRKSQLADVLAALNVRGWLKRKRDDLEMKGKLAMLTERLRGRGFVPAVDSSATWHQVAAGDAITTTFQLEEGCNYFVSVTGQFDDHIIDLQIDQNGHVLGASCAGGVNTVAFTAPASADCQVKFGVLGLPEDVTDLRLLFGRAPAGRLPPPEDKTLIASGLEKYGQSDMEGALAEWDRALALNPVDADGYRLRGRVRKERGDLAGALEDETKAVELSPFHFEPYFVRGTVRLLQGDLAGAIADQKRALELDPRRAVARASLGEAMRHRGDLMEALADQQAALLLDPQCGLAFRERGALKLIDGDLPGAIADASKASGLDPNDAQAYLVRGVALSVQGDWLKAYSDFDAAVHWSPDPRPPALYRWMAQTRFGGRADAMDELRAALGRASSLPDSWAGIVARFLLGQSDEASLLRAAAEDRARICQAWYFAGVVRLAAGEKAAARACYRKCVATEAKTLPEYLLGVAELAPLP